MAELRGGLIGALIAGSVMRAFVAYVNRPFVEMITVDYQVLWDDNRELQIWAMKEASRA